MHRTIMVLAFAAGVVGTTGCGSLQYQNQGHVQAHRHGVDVSHSMEKEAKARKEADDKLRAELADQQADLQEMEQKFGMKVSAVGGGGMGGEEGGGTTAAGGTGTGGGAQRGEKEGGEHDESQARLQIALPVNFETDSADVNPDDAPALDDFAQLVQDHFGDLNLTIQGYTDPSGSKEHNEQLSQQRADAVRDYLVDKGLDGDRIRAVGLGEALPVVPGASGDTAGGEANRRVVFVIESAQPNTPAIAG